jgi:hypothetical protein
LGARGVSAAREISDIPRDFSAAQSGLTRLNAYDQPTYGARLQGVAEDVGDVMARRQAMRPDEGAPAMPGFSSFTDIVPDTRMYAVKPGGGNNPLNLGSTLPLKEQGKMGAHLSEAQYSDPVAIFEQQLQKHFPRGIDNRNLLRDWEDYLKGYLAVHANGVEYSDPNGAAMQALKKEAADKFAENHNIAAADIDPTNKKLNTASQIEQVLPAYNSWVMGPYQKYITNQMGTGVPTDPYLKEINEANIPLHELFGLDAAGGNITRAEDAEKRRARFLRFNQENPNFDPNAPQNANIGKQTATTEFGKQLEDYLDNALYPNQASNYYPEKFPQVSKMPKETIVTDFLISEPWKQTGLEAIQKRMLQDLLNNNEVDINKISNRTPALIAKDMINEYKIKQKSKDAIQKAKDDWRAARYDSIESVIPFDDGTKIQIIRPEDVKTEAGKLLALRDLGQSTVDLKQCIGAGCMNTPDYTGHGPYIEPHTGKPARQVADYGATHVKRYMERLEKDKAEIARLIDKDGVSQASVDLHYEIPRTLRVSQQVDAIASWLGNNDPQALPEFERNVDAFGIAEAVKNAYQLYPEVYQYVEKLNKTSKKFITEMKGFKNGEIPEKFVPHMVQWLNSMGNQLSDVGDLKNIPNVHDLEHESNSISKLMEKNQHWYIPTVEEFFETMEKEKALPRFFTTDEFALKATERGVDLSAEPKRAEGEQAKYPEGATLFQMDMIDYFEPGAIRKSYGGYDRIISYNSRTGEIVASEVKRDENGNWIDHPSYGGPRAHTTVPTPEEFQRAMGRPMRLATRQLEADQQFQPERVDPQTREVLAMNMHDYFENPEGDDYYANLDQNGLEDMRILMGNQAERSRLPRFAGQAIAEMLLDQDTHTQQIRELINQLQATGNQGMVDITEPQAENMLNILIDWTERYPLNE